MISTRFPLLGAIAVIAVMIMNCRVAVAGPNQTLLRYAWVSGCGLTDNFFQLSRVRRTAFSYELLCGDRYWPQLHGPALRHMFAHWHDFSTSRQCRRSVYRRTAREDSRGLQPFSC